MRRRAQWLLLIVLLVGVALTAQASDPSARWHIVHGRCVPDQQMHHDPAPCTVVDLAQGYAVLKDLVGKTQFPVIPTARVGGIEDKAVLAANAPDYFADAWRARRYVDQRAGRVLPRDDIALAINSIYGRTQDQLHIHVDCVRPDVRAALAKYQSVIGLHWAAFPVPLAGQHYRVMRLSQPTLGSTNPFRLLAATVPQAKMGLHTLVVVGADFAGHPGFVLLDDSADLAAGDRGSGESLQDHGCTLAH